MVPNTHYRFMLHRSDGVEIYKSIPGDHGGGGTIPTPIQYIHEVDTFDNTLDVRLRTLRGTVSNFRDDPITTPTLITAKNRIKEIDEKLEFFKNRHKWSIKGTLTPLFLAGIAVAGCLKIVGLCENQEKLATNEAMKNPAVMINAQSNAYTHAREQVADDTKKSILSFTPGSPDPGQGVPAKINALRDQFYPKALQKSAEETHYLDEAVTIGYLTAAFFLSIITRNFFIITHSSSKIHQANRLQYRNQRFKKHIDDKLQDLQNSKVSP